MRKMTLSFVDRARMAADAGDSVHRHRRWRWTSQACGALWLAAAVLSTMPAGVVADVAVQKSSIFVAGEGGYASYRIPGIVRASDGTLLAFAEARTNDASDYGNIDTVVRRSSDGGETWGNTEKLVDLGTSTVNNNVMIVDKQNPGVVHFLYCQDYKRAFYCKSTDNGRTFSSAKEITQTFSGFRRSFNWLLLATGPSHSIQLNNGRLLVPIWLASDPAQYPSAVGTIYSDDFGVTWKRGEIVGKSGEPADNPMEGFVAQLSDGRVMMNFRNEGPTTSTVHHRAVSYSPNGISDWTTPTFDTALKEPCCEGSLLAVPAEIGGAGGMMLFSNPDNADRAVSLGPTWYCDRKNVTVKLSLDDGATWAKSLVIEPSFSGYSDLAMTPDGKVLCLYERGAIGNYYEPRDISLARFNLRDLHQVPEPSVAAMCATGACVLASVKRFFLHRD